MYAYIFLCIHVCKHLHAFVVVFALRIDIPATLCDNFISFVLDTASMNVSWQIHAYALITCTQVRIYVHMFVNNCKFV